MEMNEDERVLTATEIMNVIHNALGSNARAGFIADAATILGALHSLILIEERQYLSAVARQVKEQQR